eukprot:jgi/Mesvir1/21465/Mv03921-RA.1
MQNVPVCCMQMPDKISQRQQPVATLATLVEALRVHQVLLEDHLSNTGKHNKIEIAGLTDGEVMAFKGLARHLGFVNALPAGMDGSIPDLIRAILKGFLLPLSDADGALLEERGQWAAREQQLLASIAQLQADLAFRQGVLNTSIKDYLELQDEIKTLQEEDAREPRAALKRKLEEVTAECAQLDAEVDRKKEKLKEMEKWPVFELQRELDRSRRCLTMNADGELADVVHRRNKKTLVTRRDALLGARDSLMSFSIGMAKKSLPMLRIMRTRIATLQHKRPPAPVAWPDQEILKKHIGTGETRLSSQGVLLSLPARDKRRFDERAIAKHSRDVRDARLWVKLRDTIPGGCSVRVTAGAKKILGPVVPCEQLIQQARKDQTERVDSIVPLYRTNIAEDVTAMPDFETGVYGWQNHPTNSAQLMVMRLFLENPDSPVWRDMKVTKRAKLDIGCGGDGHRTRLGAGTMNMLAMSIRPVDPAFPDLWQRPDWVSVNLESPGGDKRANLLKNAAAWLEVIKYLAGHEIPVVLDGVEIMIKFRVFILGDMAWQWAMRGCGGMSDPDKHFCHLCDAHEDDRFVLFQMAHPLPGETLPEFARRHFMGVREAREINKWFAGQPRTGPAWESELELRKYTTDTTVGPTINLALYPDDETSTDAQPSDGGARASQRRSARTSGKALPSSALLRVHRTMPMDRKSDHDLIPGIPAWQYGFDWEHCVTRIVEALLKIIQTEDKSGQGDAALRAAMGPTVGKHAVGGAHIPVVERDASKKENTPGPAAGTFRASASRHFDVGDTRKELAFSPPPAGPGMHKTPGGASTSDSEDDIVALAIPEWPHVGVVVGAIASSSICAHFVRQSRYKKFKNLLDRLKGSPTRRPSAIGFFDAVVIVVNDKNATTFPTTLGLEHKGVLPSSAWNEDMQAVMSWAIKNKADLLPQILSAGPPPFILSAEQFPGSALLAKYPATLPRLPACITQDSDMPDPQIAGLPALQEVTNVHGRGKRIVSKQPAKEAAATKPDCPKWTNLS